ncbi:MAG TPA: alpha/beta hydrolase [Actinomycetota bacterium]|nr:alpha/beta hydrolase [Actinomycetota bacterium]
MRTVRNDDVTLSYRTWGAGPPLLLIHGGAGTGRDLALVRQHLQDGFTVAVMDRRGRSGNDARRAHTIGDEARDILAVIDDIGEPVHAFGHSYGAICLMEAAAAGAPLRSMTVYEPPVRGPELADRLRGVARLIEEGRAEEAMRSFLVRVGATEEQLAVLREIGEWERVVAGCGPFVGEVGALTAWEPDLERLGELTIPVVYLEGADTASDFYDRDRVMSWLPAHTRVVSMPGQTHTAIGFAPALVADAIRLAAGPQPV